MTSTRVNIIEPSDLLAAAKARAISRGYVTSRGAAALSAYIGELLLADLPAKEARRIKPRPTVGAPRKAAT